MRKIVFCLALLAALSFSAGAYAAEKPNLNTVTQEELASDPAIGAELAKKIVEFRSDAGDFASWDDVKGIEGMTDALLKQLEEKFQIVGVEAVDCNC